MYENLFSENSRSPEKGRVGVQGCGGSGRHWRGIENDAKHCNSCLLIISASISGSKPPANADRTLSLSRAPHFVSPPPPLPVGSPRAPSPLAASSLPGMLYGLPSAPLPLTPPSRLPSIRVYAARAALWRCMYARDTVAAKLSQTRVHPVLAGVRRSVCTSDARTVDTANNLITSHRQCVLSHRSSQISGR